jgi:hypothetical protein
MARCWKISNGERGEKAMIRELASFSRSGDKNGLCEEEE